MAASIGSAGRRRRHRQDVVGGRRRGRAVVAVALLRGREGPGGHGRGGRGAEVERLWLRSEAALVVRLRERRL